MRFTPPIAITGMVTALRHLRKLFDAVRFAEGDLRWRIVDRPEVGVAGARAFRHLRAFKTVAGNSDEKIGGRIPRAAPV